MNATTFIISIHTFSFIVLHMVSNSDLNQKPYLNQNSGWKWTWTECGPRNNTVIGTVKSGSRATVWRFSISTYHYDRSPLFFLFSFMCSCISLIHFLLTNVPLFSSALPVKVNRIWPDVAEHKNIHIIFTANSNCQAVTSKATDDFRIIGNTGSMRPASDFATGPVLVRTSHSSLECKATVPMVLLA